MNINDNDGMKINIVYRTIVLNKGGMYRIGQVMKSYPMSYTTTSWWICDPMNLFEKDYSFDVCLYDHIWVGCILTKLLWIYLAAIDFGYETHQLEW